MPEPGRAERRSVRETAPAKVNLILQVGPRRRDGLHDLCSLFASIDLADEITVAIAEPRGGPDEIRTPGVHGPDICVAALAALRAEIPGGDLPTLDVTVEKRIPIAGGLGGGSADAAAVLRAANELAGSPLSRDGLRAVATRVGADVPSQIEPTHAVVGGVGELVEPVGLPSLWLVLVPQHEGLSTAEVYAEADRIGATRPNLDPEAVYAAARQEPRRLAESIGNDLQAAALSLRPELRRPLTALREAGAIGALLSGSGPTAVGVFEDERSARYAANAGDIVARVRNNPQSWERAGGLSRRLA